MTHTEIDKEIDIYSNKLELDTQEAMIKADEMLAMIGVIRPIVNCQCTREAEKEEYSAINRNIIKRNIALEVMLDASKKEILELKEKVSSLREQLSTLQKVR